MARELKFRVWDKKQSKFRKSTASFAIDMEGRLLELIISQGFTQGTYFDDSPCFMATNVYRSLDDYIVQYFTGRKDNNGRDIFEGDILRWFHGIEDVGVCEWVGEEVAFLRNYPDQCYFGVNVKRLGNCHFQEDDDYWVIGNIFENKDLLNE